MSLDKPKPKEDDSPDMSRRGFLKGVAALGVTAGALGAMAPLKSYIDKRQADIDAENAIEREHTRLGKALIISKLDKKAGSGQPTMAEFANSAISGYMLNGVTGSLLMLSVLESTAQMDTGHDYYLLVKIDDHEPFAMHTVPIEYKNTKVGDTVNAEYVLDEKNEQIKRVFLNPQNRR